MKILFIHGLASSGAYKMASSLRILLKPCEVISPDVPIDPDAALSLLRKICREQQPDLVVGLSLGGFWAQKLRGCRKILFNPDLHPSILLRSKTGTMQYLSPRENGDVSFEITAELCDRYEAMEKTEFDGIDSAETALTTGMFATDDELVRCGPEFELHYPGRKVDYPGTHLPDYPQLKQYLVPVARKILSEVRAL